MSLNKNGMDLKAIHRDQKAIDKLPNKGRASVDHSKSHSKALSKAKVKSKGKEMSDYSHSHNSGSDDTGGKYNGLVGKGTYKNPYRAD